MVGTEKPLIEDSTDVFLEYGDCVVLRTAKYNLHCKYIHKEDFETLLPRGINLFKVKIKIDSIIYETL